MWKVFVILARLYATVTAVSSSQAGSVDAAIYTVPPGTLSRNGDGVQIETCFHNWSVDYPAHVFVTFGGAIIWKQSIHLPNDRVCAFVRVVRKSPSSIDVMNFGDAGSNNHSQRIDGFNFSNFVYVKATITQREDAPQGQVTFDYMTVDFGRVIRR